MLIIGDQGTDVVNEENVFSISIGAMPDGMAVLVAYGLGAQLILAGVGDRPQRALECIVKAKKENWKVCDLNDLLGQRPNLTVASAITGKNGEKLRLQG